MTWKFTLVTLLMTFTTMAHTSNGSLTVRVNVDDAVIRIMNIEEKYHPGILLNNGDAFLISVFKEGYYHYRGIVDITGQTTLNVELVKSTVDGKRGPDNCGNLKAHMADAIANMVYQGCIGYHPLDVNSVRNFAQVMVDTQENLSYEGCRAEARETFGMSELEFVYASILGFEESFKNNSYNIANCKDIESRL